MSWKSKIVCIVSLTLSLAIIASCVSKKEYVLKVDETEKLSRELTALKFEHARLEGENESLKKQLTALQEERNELEKAKTDLQLKNLALEKEITRLEEDNLELERILGAKSDTMSQNIVDLRAHVADLKKENSLLLDRIVALQEKNEALRSKVQAIERKRQEEMEEVKSTYDNLIEGMKSEIEQGKITITQLEGKLKVNMLAGILFDSGKTTIKPEGVEVLERVGKILLDVKDRAINIEGHTDNVPIGTELRSKYPTNWELSAARATTVARYLQEKIGIDPDLLSATGYGEYHPVASNDSEEGRAKNRRIEILLVPKEIRPVSKE